MTEIARGTAHRVLAIGAPDAAGATTIEEALAPDGMLIVMDGDTARADDVRRRLRDAGLGTRATIIAADPRRMLYKLAGPFDIIVCTGCDAGILERARALLGVGGILIAREADA